MLPTSSPVKNTKPPNTNEKKEKIGPAVQDTESPKKKMEKTNTPVKNSGLLNANQNFEKTDPADEHTEPPKKMLEKSNPPLKYSGPPDVNQNFEKTVKDTEPPCEKKKMEKPNPLVESVSANANRNVEKEGPNLTYVQNKVHPAYDYNKILITQPQDIVRNNFNTPQYYNVPQRTALHLSNCPTAYLPYQQQLQPCPCQQFRMMQPVAVNVQTTYIPQNFPTSGYPPVYPPYQQVQNLVKPRIMTGPTLPNQPLIYQVPVRSQQVPVLYKTNKKDIAQCSTKEVLASFAKLLALINDEQAAAPKIGKHSSTSQQAHQMLEDGSIKEILVNFAKLLKEIERNQVVAFIEETSQTPRENNGASTEDLIDFTCRPSTSKTSKEAEEAISDFTRHPATSVTKKNAPKEIEVLASFAKLLGSKDHNEVKSKEVLVSFAELLQNVLQQEDQPPFRESSSLNFPVNMVTQEFQGSTSKPKTSSVLLKQKQTAPSEDSALLNHYASGELQKNMLLTSKKGLLKKKQTASFQESSTLNFPINIVQASPQEHQLTSTSETRSALLFIKPKIGKDVSYEEEDAFRNSRILALSRLERKVYHPDFLMALKNSPKSNEKPENILDAVSQIKIIKSKLQNDNESILRYKENQWSPYNVQGEKVYDREFLLALKNFPKNNDKPKNISNAASQSKSIEVDIQSDIESFLHYERSPYNLQEEKVDDRRDFLMVLKNSPKSNEEPVNISDAASQNKTNMRNIQSDNELVLRYEDNQWSPYNLQGEKVYDRDSLVALRNRAQSKEKPDALWNTRKLASSENQHERKVYHLDFLMALRSSPKSNEKPENIPDALSAESNRGKKNTKMSKSKGESTFEETQFPACNQSDENVYEFLKNVGDVKIPQNILNDIADLFGIQKNQSFQKQQEKKMENNPKRGKQKRKTCKSYGGPSTSQRDNEHLEDDQKDYPESKEMSSNEECLLS